MKKYKFPFVVSLLLSFCLSSVAHTAVKCKNLKPTDFEKKTVEVANQLIATGVINESALTFSGPSKKRALNAVCKTHDTPHFDDGGSRCTFKCSIDGEESMSAIFFENFNSKIVLSEIKYDINH